MLLPSSKSRDGVEMREGADVLIATPLGNVSLRVFPARSPVTAADFLKHVDAGHFAGAAFYRTVRRDNDHSQQPIQVVQGGLVDLTESFDRLVHEPTHVTGLRHVDGTVSAARLGLGSASAATFFVCVGDQPALDFGGLRHPDGQGFAAFGQVIAGMDVVRRIYTRPTVANAPRSALAGQMLAEPVPFLSVARIVR